MRLYPACERLLDVLDVDILVLVHEQRETKRKSNVTRCEINIKVWLLKERRVSVRQCKSLAGLQSHGNFGKCKRLLGHQTRPSQNKRSRIIIAPT